MEDEYIPSYLTNLEEEVLSLFTARDRNYSYRFNGLKRLLNDVHQQKLTRALERLQEDNLIERRADGSYRLDGRNYDRIYRFFNNKNNYEVNSGQEQNNRLIARAISNNSDFPVEQIVEILTGRYFGKWRFVGHSYSPENRVGRLEWINSDYNSLIFTVLVTNESLEIRGLSLPYLYDDEITDVIAQILLSNKVLVKFQRSTEAAAN